VATLQKVQIFPAIGIARIGNSQEWYLGPELPFPAPPSPPPGGTYKDANCRIKRQAQRFRLWGFFSDNTDRELTLADGDITWTVHLANSKPSLNAEGIIDGGLQTLHGAAATASFQGTFGGVNVPLGDAETDGDGRLIVRGGFGKSENPTDPGSAPNFPTTPGWYDDVSDGPITAQIKIGANTFQAVNGAWVICPPPRYAPTTYSVTSLYDTLRQLAITKGQLPVPGLPSFANDIYPILKRALDMRFVSAFAFGAGDHDTLAVFAPPGGLGDTLANRQSVFNKLRPGGDMPLLFDGGGTTSQLRDFQHTFLQQWSQGQGTADWPPVAPTTITPDGLTRAALENCVGAAFFPGIESGGINASVQITSLAFAEAFRLDQTVQPGDATKGMARPWQGDFMLCSGPGSDAENDQSSWWPAARPIGIFPFDDPTNKRLWTLGVATSMSDMVKNWHELGFIVDTGVGHPVETEKTNVCKTCFFVTNRSEISKDEAQALIDSGENIQDGFFVVVQGLAPSALSITTSNPSQAQLNAWAPKITPNPNPNGVSFSPADLGLENSADLNQVQRVTFGYNISFSSVAAFTAEDVTATLTAAIAGLSCFSTLDLTTRQHPYMVAGPISWLSADTRVFSRQPNGTFANVTLGNDPNGFIKSVIDSLRGAAPATAKAWFDALPSTESGSQLEWSQFINGQPIYNFAVCRVHYRAKLNTAPDVRVFFRLFPAMTTSTDFQPATTYFTGGQPGTKIPLLGIVGGEVVTIPFFAEPRNPSNMPLHLQTDPKNIDTLKIDPGGHETFSYYACWLDINQPSDKRYPLQTSNPDGPFTGPTLESIADLIRGTHQCLVAEINFDLDPITPGATAANSDKLGQRNLSIDHSDNPGATDTHRVQHTFTIRPTTLNPQPRQGPDELMIDWGATPPGTVGSLYLPGVSAAEIMGLADRLYTRNRWKPVDAYTVQTTVTGRVSYCPVPSGGLNDLAGLLTLDLPATVRAGQIFRVVLHQVVDSPAARPRPPITVNRPSGLERTPAALATAGVVTAAVVERRPTARHFLGAFQFSVLVQTRREILPIVERVQANLRRIIATIPHENRWYPVIHRYLQQVTGKVTGLGGGQGEGGPGPHRHEHERREEHRRFEGKIAGLRYDRFGDFEGFSLRTEDGLRQFFTRERGMESVAHQAWRERIAVLVITEEHELHEPVSIVFLRAPSDE
jgi:hypothetical protein